MLRRFAVSCIAAAACSQVYAVEIPDPSADAGSDAGEDARDDSAIIADAGSEAARTGCAARDAAGMIFCDDFERTTAVADGWLVATLADGTLEISTARATSGTRALRAEIEGTGGATYKEAHLTTRPFDAGGFPIIVELDFFAEVVPAFADAPYNGFIFLVYDTPSGNIFAASGISGPNAYNPYLGQTDAVVQIPSSEWRHIVLTIDDQLVTLTVSNPAGPPLTRMRTTTSGMAPDRIKIGPQTGQHPVRVFIDDVVIRH